MSGPLEGFTVGVTADRRRDDQAVLLGRLGVEVVLGPVLRTEVDPVDDDLLVATKRIIADPPDVLVANTGFGIRSWWARAAAWGLDGELTAALADTRVAARGPKASGALRSLGLAVWWRSPTEQLASVVDHLLAVGVDGANVALQLHGEDSEAVMARLRAGGASVIEVPVYRWSLPTDDRAAVALIRRCCEGSVDAVTFTAGPAVRQFLDLAEAEGVADELLAALNRRMTVVCVGPVCAAVAEEEGIEAPVVPEHWRLGAMVKQVGTALAERCWDVASPEGTTTIRGGRLEHAGTVTDLPTGARRALALLVARDGGPVTTAEMDALGMDVDGLRQVVPMLAGAVSESGGLVRLAGRRRLHQQGTEPGLDLEATLGGA